MNPGLQDVVFDVVENQDTHLPREENPHTPTDRALILGSDGRWVAGWALRFIILVVAGYLLWKGFAIIWAGLLPVMLALLVSTVLWPPVAWLRSRKVPPALAVLVTILGFFAVFGAVIALIAPSVSSQSRDLVRQATAGFETLYEWVQGPPINADLSSMDRYVNELLDVFQQRSSQIASGVFSGLTTAGTILVTLVLMLVLTFFFLKDGPNFLPMVRRIGGPNAGWHLTEVLTRVWNTLAGFIRTQAVVSGVDAIFIGIGLLILNVPMAFALAVVTFFAGFIPIVGAFTAGALAVAIALVTNGPTNALMVLALIILVQQIEGNVLQPMLQSKAMNLHAAVVLLSVTLGSTLFGVVGAFLAVPVAATIAVLIRYHQELVALRAGEITIEDMEMATTNEAAAKVDAAEAWAGFRARLIHLSASRVGRGAGKQPPADGGLDKESES